MTPLYFVFFDSLRAMIFISVQFLIAITNAILMKRLEKFPKAKLSPKVSVLIPARNEEKTVANCINSLLNQDYNDMEIIVLNDNSQDRTAEILKSFESDRLRVINSEPLPAGWIGKSWACHQLALEAKGDLILFTDADTIYKSETISCAVNAMLKEHTDLLTAVNHNEVKTFGEQVTVTFPIYSIFTILPLTIAYLFPRLRAFSAANGKFMFFRKNFYKKIGGHEAIKENVLDDVELARMTRAHGGKLRLMNVARLISVRMYQGFSEALEGFTKNYFALFGYKILVALFIWTWMGLITFYPIVTLISCLARVDYSHSLIYAAISIVITWFMWLLLSLKFRLPIHLFLLYPLTISVSIFIGIRSMILSILGKTTWKGRRIKSGKVRWI